MNHFAWYRPGAVPHVVLAGLAIAALAALVLSPRADAKSTVVELRVEGPAGTLDPGTWYATGTERLKRSRSGDACVRRTGSIRVPGPTAMGLPQTGSESNADLRQVRIRRDEAGLFMCEIASVVGRPFSHPDGFSGWTYWQDYVAGTAAADQVRLRSGDRILWVYSDFGTTTPLNQGDALELRSVDPGTTDGSIEVRVVAHRFDGGTSPAEGVTIEGAQSVTELGAGRYNVSLGEGLGTLKASRGLDIPSQPVETCFRAAKGQCPRAHGRTIVGLSTADSLRGTQGWDQIDSGRGRDRIDLAGGGRDRVNCGPGHDLVLRKRGDRNDQIHRSCERIRT
jgi:RTX calcium-binding nonapeptide repeat (4 copies)